MKEKNLVFAADLGGTHLRAAVIDDTGQIYHRLKRTSPESASANDIVSALVSAARECEEQTREHGVAGRASVAVPGTVNVADGIVLTAPNIPSLTGFHLAQSLEAELNKPVLIENDANAAAVGEMWQGAAQGVRSNVCITLGTGVGGGIILDGKLWRGADGSAGEIGHMAIEPFGGVRCGCGSQGCLEVYASATALVRMLRESTAHHPDSNLPGTEDLTAEAIYRWAMSGNKLAIDVFKRMGVYLGIGLANLVNILNPEMIVIAGGVANGWDLFSEHAIEEMRQRAFPLPASRVVVKPGQCGDNAGLLGAAKLAFDRLSSRRAPK